MHVTENGDGNPVPKQGKHCRTKSQPIYVPSDNEEKQISSVSKGQHFILVSSDDEAYQEASRHQKRKAADLDREENGSKARSAQQKLHGPLVGHRELRKV